MTLYEETPTSTAVSPPPSSIQSTPAAARVGYTFLTQVGQMRLLVVIGVVLTGHFLWWFADSDHVGYAPLFWLLTVSLGFKLLRML
ncbi:hypothetical protein, partial [Hymenobacter glacieicola]|uniref:hypothetical protein n=1 Tax=Hymenobacter glacieicola TaxID=1562124 RepID=UPI00166A8221